MGISIALLFLSCTAQNEEATLKSVLLEQLKHTHTEEDWFTPTKKALAGVTGKQLNKWSYSIANIAAHNAYHSGQIIYIRKHNGWWKTTK
jgi:hypothetical protein